ncbi:hypothetical protein KAR91_56295 [Candidatus Pacearchaeota archaeon]|nr:hypothetical protein [Candidatus Pacearchaeota archaeon]
MGTHKVSDGCGGYDTVEYHLDHYVLRSQAHDCQGCGTNLGLYSVTLDIDSDVPWQWMVVKCQRCGAVSLIDL